MRDTDPGDSEIPGAKLLGAGWYGMLSMITLAIDAILAASTMEAS